MLWVVLDVVKKSDHNMGIWERLTVCMCMCQRMGRGRSGQVKVAFICDLLWTQNLMDHSSLGDYLRRQC